MQRLFFFLFLFCLMGAYSQSGQKYLYLNNPLTDKTKRLNLDRAMHLNITEDSISGQDEGTLEYTCDPFLTKFGTEEMTLTFWEYSAYGDNFVNGSNYYSEDYILLAEDSTITLPYANPVKDVNLYLSYQTPVREVFYSFGLGLLCTSLFSAVVVSPLLGMNNGTFQNYSWSRLGRYELFSGLGIVTGFSMCAIFVDKQFYFQSQNDLYHTWRVVEPGEVN